MINEEQESGQNRDFKYILNDNSYIYLGARFNYKELLTEDMAPFKLKAIISRYILKDVDEETTLESHFYHMTADSLAYKTYCELRVKIKVSMPEEKRGLTGKSKYIYKDKIFTLKTFEELNLAKKKKSGLIVREIIISKLGLLTFAV